MTLLRMSALLALFYAAPEWETELPMRVLAALGLLFPKLLHNSHVWLALASLQIFGLVLSWGTADNHKYLIAYWFLAVWLSTLFDPSSRKFILAENGRWLIAGAMGFAVLSKIISQDYLSGDFFTFALLTDERFRLFTEFVSGFAIDSDTLKANQDLLNQIKEDPTLDSIELVGVDRVAWLAGFITYWTLVLEFLVAALFLMMRWPRLAHASLVLFVATTYPVATVSGFAWVICCCGFAHASTLKVRWALFYPIFFVAVFVLEYPIAKLFGIA